MEEQKKLGSQSCDVGINTLDRSEKAGENGGKVVFMEFVHRIWLKKLDMIKKFHDYQGFKERADMFKEWGESNNTNYTFLKKKYGMEIELIRITPRY